MKFHSSLSLNCECHTQFIYTYMKDVINYLRHLLMSLFYFSLFDSVCARAALAEYCCHNSLRKIKGIKMLLRLLLLMMLCKCSREHEISQNGKHSIADTYILLIYLNALVAHA